MMDSVNIDVPNSRALVKQILILAQEAENQPFIAQEDGCLSGLCNYLNHEDTDVVLMAARSMQFLASHPSARTHLIRFPNLLATVRQVEEEVTSHPKAKEFCAQTLDYLGVKKAQEQTNTCDNGMNNPAEPSQEEHGSTLNDCEQECNDSSGMPEYLDESDYDDEDSDNNERMTTWGCSSLEERLERQRQEEQQRVKNSRIIGKVGTIFSSASSWLLGY